MAHLSTQNGHENRTVVTEWVKKEPSEDCETAENTQKSNRNTVDLEDVKPSLSSVDALKASLALSKGFETDVPHVYRMLEDNCRPSEMFQTVCQREGTRTVAIQQSSEFLLQLVILGVYDTVEKLFETKDTLIFI